MSSESKIPNQHQAAFTPDGELVFDTEAVETTLVDHGVKLDLRQRRSRLEQPTSDEFVDIRPQQGQSNSGEQGALIASDDYSQVTIEGEDVAGRCLFE